MKEDEGWLRTGWLTYCLLRQRRRRRRTLFPWCNLPASSSSFPLQFPTKFVLLPLPFYCPYARTPNYGNMEGETGKSIWMPTKKMAFWAAHHSLLKRHSAQRNPALGKTGPRALPSLMRKTRARAASSCRGAREPPNPKSDSLSGSFGMALLSSSAPPCHAHTGGGGGDGQQRRMAFSSSSKDSFGASSSSFSYSSHSFFWGGGLWRREKRGGGGRGASGNCASFSFPQVVPSMKYSPTCLLTKRAVQFCVRRSLPTKSRWKGCFKKFMPACCFPPNRDKCPPLTMLFTDEGTRDPFSSVTPYFFSYFSSKKAKSFLESSWLNKL